MLQHIALTVNDPEEIKDFFEKVLLFEVERKFILNTGLNQQIFNNEGEVDVYNISSHDARFEIFVSPEKEKLEYAHVCLAYKNSEDIYNKAIKSGYKTVIKENPGYDTYFIWDKSDNMFEIKEDIAG